MRNQVAQEANTPSQLSGQGRTPLGEVALRGVIRGEFILGTCFSGIGGWFFYIQLDSYMTWTSFFAMGNL